MRRRYSRPHCIAGHYLNALRGNRLICLRPGYHRRMTRIAILGTSGSGKSTLVRALAQRQAVPRIDENFTGPVAAYQALEISSRRNEPDALRAAATQYAQASRAWVTERLSACRALPAFVADRSCFDILNNCLSADVGHYAPGLLRVLLRNCSEESRLMDLYVLLPIGAAALNAGTNEDGLPRRTNFGRKLRAHATLLGLLEQISAAPVLRLGAKDASVEARCAQVEARLARLAARTARPGTAD